jgi:hypothetical protein
MLKVLLMPHRQTWMLLLLLLLTLRPMLRKH